MADMFDFAHLISTAYEWFWKEAEARQSLQALHPGLDIVVGPRGCAELAAHEVNDRQVVKILGDLSAASWPASKSDFMDSAADLAAELREILVTAVANELLLDSRIREVFNLRREEAPAHT